MVVTTPFRGRTMQTSSSVTRVSVLDPDVLFGSGSVIRKWLVPGISFEKTSDPYLEKVRSGTGLNILICKRLLFSNYLSKIYRYLNYIGSLYCEINFFRGWIPIWVFLAVRIRIRVNITRIRNPSSDLKIRATDIKS